ncbi:hypothetical protein SLA2020_471130 [Shorea laevis]
MGNCQSADAATVVIQHPGNKIERIYWSVSVKEVMSSNPGHYVALVVTSPTLKNENGVPLKQLKLLRPNDTLLIGHVYRLISSEDVLKEFAAKKCVKLGKLLEERGSLTMVLKEKRECSGSSCPNPNPNPKSGKCSSVKDVHNSTGGGSSSGSGSGSSGNKNMGRHRSGGSSGGGRQWRPALQSIAEIGS